MEKISSYTVGVNLDSLRDSFKLGRVPESLKDPFQALLPRLTGVAAQKPTTIYVFSEDDVAETRNLFGYAIANGLAQHIPSTTLVDCSFLDVGLSGVVPHKDGLGFLDMLSYGSSLNVITQETNGAIRVVGAGSFPMTKKMPVALSSFEEAVRRLTVHCGCTVFCGPLQDDDGGLFPLIGIADVPIYVNLAPGVGAVQEVEEQISRHWDKELYSVRITTEETPKAEAAPTTPGQSVPRPTEPWLDELEPALNQQQSERSEEPPASGDESAPVPDEAAEEVPPPSSHREPPTEVPEVTRPPQPEWPSPVFDLGEEPALPGRERRYTSLLPKIATGAVAVIVVLFILWWLNTERNGGETTEPIQDSPETSAQSVESQQPDLAVDTGELEGGSPPAESTLVAETGQPAGEPGGSEQTESTEPAAQAGVGQGETDQTATGPVRIDSSNILVIDDLKENWVGWYFIHISSFRGSDLARKEVAGLEERGFPVFIVLVNLGAKGSWYRVYAGPVETREGARNLKKLLDDTPGVRFTRITQISGKP